MGAIARVFGMREKRQVVDSMWIRLVRFVKSPFRRRESFGCQAFRARATALRLASGMEWSLIRNLQKVRRLQAAQTNGLLHRLCRGRGYERSPRGHSPFGFVL